MFTPQALRPPTSADVARAANVSRATVSFVLNDKPDARVSPATRERVLQVARDLGYTPSHTAQALRSGARNGILVPIPGSGELGPYESMLRLLLLRVAARGAGVDVVLSGRDDPTDAAREWAGRRPKGVIAAAELCTAQATQTLRRAGVQALVVIGADPVEYAPCLVLDEGEYGARAVKYLVGKGHRRLAYLGPAGTRPDSSVGRREAGIREAAEAAGCPIERIGAGVDPATLRDWTHSWRYAQGPPTAVVAYDDLHAFAALKALGDAGLDVPGQVAVLGADDHPVAPLYRPALSTVTRDLDLLVTALLDAMDRLLAGEIVDRVPVPALRVVERESA